MLESIRKKLREEEEIKIKDLNLDGDEGEEEEDFEDFESDEDEPSTEGGKEIQTHLEAALEAARGLGDEKLVDQIGNTITFYTRTHIVGDQNVDESNLFENKRRRGKLPKGRVKIDESLKNFQRLAGILTEAMDNTGDVDFGDINNPPSSLPQTTPPPQNSPLDSNGVKDDIFHLWDDNIDDSRNGIEGFNTRVGITFEFFYDSKWGRDFDEFMSDVQEYFNENGITEYKYDNNHSTLEIYI